MSHSFVDYPRVTLVSSDDYDVMAHVTEIEGERLTFVHLDVFRWTPSVLKRLLAEWPSVRSRLGDGMVFCMPDVPDDKFIRFARLFGWLKGRLVLCTDGVARPLFFHIPG